MYRSVVECLSSMCEVLGSIPGAGREVGVGKGRGISYFLRTVVKSSGSALHPCPGMTGALTMMIYSVSCSWVQTWPLPLHHSPARSILIHKLDLKRALQSRHLCLGFLFQQP